MVRTRILGALKAFVVLSVLGGGAWAFYCYLHESEHWYVQTIRIEGLSRLDEWTILRQARVTTEDNLLFLDEQAVAERVMALPYVRQCVVRREFPDTVSIWIEEREPVATLLHHNRAFAIDVEGVAVEELPLSRTRRFPGPFITELPDVDIVEAGQHIESESLTDALGVLHAFNSIALAEHVTIAELAARNRNDIRMYCEELPFEIRWGRGDYDLQARRLEVLWEYKDRSLDFEQYCDLRFGRDIAAR